MPQTLTVLREHQEQVTEYFQREHIALKGWRVRVRHHPDSPSLVWYDLGPAISESQSPFIEDLTSLGIAQEYALGPEKYPGRRTIRFTANGEEQDLWVPFDRRNPSLDKLLQIIDSTPKQPQRLAKLEAFIRDHKRQTVPLPWDGQAAFGKVYRTVQLLKTKEASNG